MRAKYLGLLHAAVRSSAYPECRPPLQIGEARVKAELDRGAACEACFRDEKLVEWVREHGKAGVCPWCASQAVHVIDLDELGPIFREVAQIYTPSEGLHGDPIGYLLQEDFEPFSELIEADTDLRDELAAAILNAGLTKDDVDEPDYDGYFHRATSSLEENWDSQIDRLFRREADNHWSNLSRVDPTGLPDQFTVDARKTGQSIVH
jgi:hypothetical protein